MKPVTILTVATMTLGILSLGAMLFAHLALTDIYHGESDVVLEWNIVRGAALVIVAFIGLSLLTLVRSLVKRPGCGKQAISTGSRDDSAIFL